MKVLTFLGALTAHETTYYLTDGREHTASFCGVALARFYPDSNMRVFVTENAREKHWDRFRALTEDQTATLLPVDIPDGANEEQLWRVFEKVVDHIDADEPVIFDITYGCSSGRTRAAVD